MNQIEQLAFKLGQQLNIQNSQICTAESCTGGGLANAITSVSGSSSWLNLDLLPIQILKNINN